MLIVWAMQKLTQTGIFVKDKTVVQRIEERLSAYKSAPTVFKQVLAIQTLCGGKIDVKERLEKNGAEGFSMFTSYLLFSALDKCGSDKTIAIAKEYYGGMLSRGATTFWEDFDIEWLKDSGRIDEETPAGLKDLHADFGKYCYTGLRHSLCHCWSSGIVAFAFEKLVGLEVLAPNYEKIKINPKLYGLQNLEAKIATPKGEIFVRVENGKTQIKVPQGIEILD